ncbi:MAG: MarR family transcriptional regulator [Acidobacteriota bacterium]|nr:MarR family transcriptional regulator [Acidobacteriota bacterium]
MLSALAAELKQSKPFESLEVEAVLSIARTAAIFEHQAAQALKPFDLSLSQYNVLRILRGAGTEGLCRNEVGKRLVTQVPDVTRLLDRMEEAGLISRQRGAEDRRYVTTRITRKGLDLVGKLDRPITELHQAQLGHVSKKTLRSLIDALAEVRAKPDFAAAQLRRGKP